MTFIRTVLGDIPSESLGLCYAHEHLHLAPSYTNQKTPDFLLDDPAAVAAELKAANLGPNGWLVDSMPGGGAGRDALALAQISRLSRLHILCPTGLHLSKYYPTGHWGDRLPEADLARLFVSEITTGVCGNDLAGPTYLPTAVRAGLIKVAGGRDKLSAQELKRFRAAASAHRTTGAPILTHTEDGTAGLEQALLLRDAGVDLSHVVLSHLDRNPDPDHHRAVLRTGVRLEYDSAFRWKPPNPNHTLSLLTTLAPEFPHQLMLGMDAARRAYWRCFGGSPGIDFLTSTFIPLLSTSLGPQLTHNLTHLNPRHAYSFSNPTE
jgi:5-phospho-D-xylono-1,4-lactonase